MKCPKCGFDQPEDIFCANCGVEVSSFAKKKTEKNRKAAILAGVAGGGVVLLIIISLLLFRGGEKAGGGSEPLSTSDAQMQHRDNAVPIPRNQNPETNPDRVTQPTEGSKPIPPSSIQSTLTGSKGLAKINIGSIGGDREEIRVVAIKNGFPQNIPFQIDSEWNLNPGREIKKDDVIYIRAADAGDQDSQAAAPGSGEEAWTAEIRDEGQAGGSGLGWVYIYKSYKTKSITESQLVNFLKSPEEASTSSYEVLFSDQHPGIVESLILNGAHILDRMKIRLSTYDYDIDESAITIEPDTSLKGPILVRSSSKGLMALDEKNDIGVERKCVYFPDRFEIDYSFDFPQEGIKDAILRIYFDLSGETKKLRIYTSDLKDGETIDGEGVTSEHQGNWFIFAGGDKSLRVTMTKGSGALVIMDDTSVADPPESQKGCLGCPGFEFSGLKGKLEINLQFEVLDWKPAGGKQPPAATNYLKSSITKLKQ